VTRRAFDFYPTPAGATNALLARVPAIIGARVIEPCSGSGAMVRPLEDAGCQVVHNDADLQWRWPLNLDARDSRSWAHFGPAEWTVTNPPFVYAAEILKCALAHTRHVAFLLRITFLEPCEGREELLTTRPPDRLIVLPRISFTGDGGTDNATCAWFIWSPNETPGIEVVPPVAVAPGTRAGAARENRATQKPLDWGI